RTLERRGPLELLDESPPPRRFGIRGARDHRRGEEMYDEHDLTDRHDVAARKRARARNHLAVDPRAVVAAEVGDARHAVLDPHRRVTTRDRRVLDADLGLTAAPDHDRAGLREV